MFRTQVFFSVVWVRERPRCAPNALVRFELEHVVRINRGGPVPMPVGALKNAAAEKLTTVTCDGGILLGC